MPSGKRVRVATNIYEDNSARNAVARVGKRRTEKRFPKSTPIPEIKAWIDRTKREQAGAAFASQLQRAPAPTPVMPRDDTAGYCYIYFIADGDKVKIGRALDPWQRLQDLQVGHADDLLLLAVVPAHASLEQALHRRFGHLHAGGEWFHLGLELRLFLEQVADHLNPVELLWDYLIVPVPTRRGTARRHNAPARVVLHASQFLRQKAKDARTMTRFLNAGRDVSPHVDPADPSLTPDTPKEN